MNVQLLHATEDPEQLICQAARNDYMADFVGETSFDDVMAGIDGDSIDEKQEQLITRLLDHGHFGPFEHPHATFAVDGVSRSCMAQLTRHRHVTFDVQSMRYVDFSEMDPAPGEGVVAIPELETAQPAGRNADIAPEFAEYDDDELTDARRATYTDAVEESLAHYRALLNMGVAPENARMVLPIGSKVNMVFSLNARMLMHVADMRAAADAQWEIRELTEQVLDLAEEWCPHTFAYYNDELKGRKNRLAP